MILVVHAIFELLSRLSSRSVQLIFQKRNIVHCKLYCHNLRKKNEEIAELKLLYKEGRKAIKFWGVVIRMSGLLGSPDGTLGHESVLQMNSTKTIECLRT